MKMPKRISAFSKAMQEAQKPADSQTAKPLEGQTSLIPEIPTVPPAKQARIKATFYLSPEAIATISSEQTKRHLATGRQPEKSDLVTEAILHYYKQHS